MSLFSFSNHKQHKLVALFDIGSASVGGALVDISTRTLDGARSSVIWSKRKEIPFQYAIDQDHFLQHIFNALKIIIKAMSAEAKEHPSVIFCTFSSPWYAAQTRIAKSFFPQPSLITQPMVNLLVDAEVAAFQSAEMPRALRKQSSRIALLEQKIMRIGLNGYTTQKPYGKRVQALDIALYVSISPRIFLDAANRLIGEEFHSDVTAYHSLAFVSFSALRDMFPERENFLLCDISGEVTDLSLVKDNILVETTSFPKGRMSMMRDMVALLKRPPEEVLSMLTLHFDGLLDSHVLSQKSDALIEKNRNEWLSSFREAVAELQSRQFLPREIEITAHPIMRQWLGPALSNLLLPFGVSGDKRAFKAHFIDAPFLRKHVLFQDATQFDVFLALEALFAEKMLNLS